MRDEREANRPNMKWDKDMQKTPMIMDKTGKFTPSTYCDPTIKPKYETEEADLDDVLIEELEMLEDAPKEAKKWKMQDLCDLRFGMEESTLSMLVQVPLEPSVWREMQREEGSSEMFALDIPFGGQQAMTSDGCFHSDPVFSRNVLLL
ncbi:sti1 [Symbiodinium pilosum]|uniref:Sti1 protein n=1 Tax=Symbiodinium pilosum TaxID=2952 RepID=A0A812QT33_SYMPI|nr:sti1 [Symbiodinium pilosum]